MSTTLTRTERVRQALDRAELAQRGFLYDEALSAVEEALRLDPGHTAARLLQARIHLHRSRPHEVLRSLDTADQYTYDEQDTEPPRLDAVLLRAASLAQIGQVGLAVAQLEHLAEAAPADVGVLQALAAMQVRDGREQDAIETLTLLCTLDPGDGVSARTLSDLLAAFDPSAAVAALGKVDDSKRLRAARCCRRAGRLLDADRHYEGLLDEHPDEPGLWHEAGALAMDMGELLRAEDRLRASLSCGRSGQDARVAWSLQAVQWMRRGRCVAAGAAWWRAIRSEPSAYPRGWAGLLTCALQADRPILMRRADRVLRSLVTRAERRALLAACWFDTVPPAFAEPGAARTPLDRTTEDDESLLTSVLADAEASLKAQAQRFPERADVRYHHAVALAAQDRAAEAREQVEAALAINRGYRAAIDLDERLAA